MLTKHLRIKHKHISTRELRKVKTKWLRLKHTVRVHFYLQLLVNRIDLALFQGKTFCYTNVYKFKLDFTKRGYTYIYIYMDKLVAYLDGSLGKSSQWLEDWIKIRQSEESTIEGRQFNRYEDPEVGNIWAHWRQRMVYIRSVSGSEEAIKWRSLP